MLSRPCGWLWSVSPEILLHLTTPAQWRAALTVGEVRPPSLADAVQVLLLRAAGVHGAAR